MSSRPPARSPLRQPTGSRRMRVPSHPDDVLRRLARFPQQVHVPSLELQRRSKPPSNPYTTGLWAVLGFVAIVVALPWLAFNRPSVKVEGIVDRASVQPASLLAQVVKITTTPASAAKKVRVKVDGIAVEPTRTDNSSTLVLGALSEGKHSISIEVGSRVLYRGPVSKKVRFTVDSTPPVPTAQLLAVPKTLEEKLTITGLSEPGAKVTVNGRDAVTDAKGKFTMDFPRAPIGALRVKAVDAAGNVGVTVLPGVAGQLMPPTRGIHVSAAAWTYAPLKKEVLALIDAKKVNTIELDLKDEDGRIGHRSKVPLVNQIGSSDNRYDLATEVADLKRRGVRVVGRLVVFRDPTLAKSAWEAGQTDQVLQGIDGKPYKGRYGAFTNPFNPTVRNYNFAIALEAAQAGVDDILLDYIRRPEADIKTLRFMGTEGNVDSARVSVEIVSFLNDMGKTLSDTPARLGASVFGIAVREGENIGQNIPEMSKSLDYIAPMIYPSAWTRGQLGVDNPPAQPYDIVYASLQEFQRASAGSGVRVIPWLQDFSLGSYKYGPKELRAQIEASANACVSDWLIWDPKVSYSSAGLPVGIQTPTKAPECPTDKPVSGEATDAAIAAENPAAENPATPTPNP